MRNLLSRLANAHPLMQALAVITVLLLAAAVFEDALRCLMRNADAHCGRRWREFEAARSWFKDDRRDWPFAFVNVCDFLGVNAKAVRTRLRAGSAGASR